MKHKIVIVATAFLMQSFFFLSCNSGAPLDINSISTDTVLIAKGKISFFQKCNGCHNFRQDGIGPALGGLTDSVSADWIKHFISDPKKMIESGDSRAQQLFKKYKVVMPSFTNFTDNEMNGLIAYLNSYRNYDRPRAKTDLTPVTNPIVNSIRLSDLSVNMELVTQFPNSRDSHGKSWARITKLDFEPHTGTSFILDLQGQLYKMQNNKPLLFMDLTKLRPKLMPGPGLAAGFGSFVFHPDFSKNGLLYTVHSEIPGSGKADFNYPDSIEVTVQCVLTEWKMNDPGADTFSGTGREMLRVDMVTYSHTVQEVTFNPLSRPGDKDYGMLYIGIGDGGCVQVDYPFLLQGIEKIWGAILRIDPAGRNSANGKYGIPADNPFAQNQEPKTVKEIYAFGFRNPHRITWSKSGKMFAFNIGQANIESVNLILPGHNYGWPVREGSFVFDPYGDLNKVYPLPANDSIYKVTYPVAQYDHDEGLAISGGYEYWGNTVPQLKGKLVFGDIPNGRLFYINMTDIKQGKQSPVNEWKISVNGRGQTLKELCGTDRVDLHFGRDASGELYILTKSDGKLYKLGAKNGIRIKN